MKTSKTISMENITFGFNQKDSQSETAVMTAIQSAGSKIVILGDEAYQNPALFLAAFLLGENVGVGFKDDSFLQSLGARLGISFSWLKSLDFTRALELAQRLAKATLAAA